MLTSPPPKGLFTNTSSVDAFFTLHYAFLRFLPLWQLLGSALKPAPEPPTYFSAISEGEREFMQHARSVTDQACQRADIDRKKVDRLREYVDYQIECYSKAFTEISIKQEQLKPRVQQKLRSSAK
ncbi:hypothetical protein G3M48_002112 [Beauveria asiatica]|uniref:Uncharacterized protein n=1 Tax=Beauveria asiatica TaxID=1069075 RepID=A0AAW0RYK9_9HYPO